MLRHQRFPVEVQSLAMCRREMLSVCQVDGSGKEELPSPNPAVQ